MIKSKTAKEWLRIMSDKQNKDNKNNNSSNQPLPDIIHTAVFKAPIQVVWDTVSTADGLSLWFMPNDFTPQEDSEFQLESPFGPSPCKLLDIEAPYRLSFRGIRKAGSFLLS